MAEEVDIYSDLQQEGVPYLVSNSDHAELDLLDASVISRQESPAKKGRAVPLRRNGPSAAATVNGFRNVAKVHNGGIAQSRQKLALQRINALRKENTVLRHNISILYATAKELISTKDKEIASLQSRLDNLVFRRNGHGNARVAEKQRCANESKPLLSAASSGRDRQKPEEACKKERPQANGGYDLSSDLNTLYCLHKTKPSLQKELKDVEYLDPFRSESPQMQSNPRNEEAVNERLGTPPVSNTSVATTSRSIRPQDRCTALRDDGRKRRRSRSPPACRPQKEARRDCVEVSSNGHTRSEASPAPCSRSSNADIKPSDVSRKERDSKEHCAQKCRESPKRASETMPRFASTGRTVTAQNSARRNRDEKRPLSDSRPERSRCLDRRSQRSSRHGSHSDAETNHSKPHPERASRDYLRRGMAHGEDRSSRHRDEFPKRNRSSERAAEVPRLGEGDSRGKTVKLQGHRDARPFAHNAAGDKSPECAVMHRGQKEATVLQRAKSEEQDKGTLTHREESRRRTELTVNRRDSSVGQRDRRSRSVEPREGGRTHRMKSKEGTTSHRDGSKERNGPKLQRGNEGEVRHKHKSKRRHRSKENIDTPPSGTVGTSIDPVHSETPVSERQDKSATVEKRCIEDLEEGEIFSD